MASSKSARFEWERIIRRARLVPSTKLVAMMLASYANKDGTNAHPSVKKLVAVTGQSKRTVLRGLDDLRCLGLITRTFHGSAAGRQGLADTYALTIPENLLEAVEMLPPSELPDDEQGADMAPDPDAEITRTGATDDTNRCHQRQEQGAEVTRTGATSAPPPCTYHPYTNQEDHSAPRAPGRGRCEHGKPFTPVASDGSGPCPDCDMTYGAA